ncbi:MAG TPA: hypothetical protein VLM05_15840 [Mycobacteriales bacterium]|nr:hypothetical protein [Mycobacteriales bacterium]
MATELDLDPGTGHRTDGAAGAVVRPAQLTYLPVDLSAHYDNRAGSAAGDTAAGAFNVWGNSFPAEHLPTPGQRWPVEGVPFVRGLPHEGGDNVRCAGQYVRLPVAGPVDWLHLMVAAERRTEATLALHFAGGAADFETLRVSDFWAEAPAAFGERLVAATPVMHYPHHVQPRVPAQLWAQRVPVTRREPLAAVRLPRHVAVHVFALTLQSTRPAGEDR